MHCCAGVAGIADRAGQPLHRPPSGATRSEPRTSGPQARSGAIHWNSSDTHGRSLRQFVPADPFATQAPGFEPLP